MDTNIVKQRPFLASKQETAVLFWATWSYAIAFTHLWKCIGNRVPLFCTRRGETGVWPVLVFVDEDWGKRPFCPVLVFINEELMKNRAQIYRVRRIFKIKNPRYLRSIFPSLFLQMNALTIRIHALYQSLLSKTKRVAHNRC